MFAAARSIASPALVENRQEKFCYGTSSCSDLTSTPRATATRAQRPASRGEYVLDLLATGTTFSSALRQDFNEPFQDEFTWRFTVSQKFAPIGGRLHASIGRGVTNPSFIEQFGFSPAPSSAIRLSCRKARSAGMPATSRRFWNGRVVVDVTYFNSRLKNEIITVFLPAPASVTRREPDRHLDAPGRRDDRKVPAGGLAPRSSGTYTYTDASDDPACRKSAARGMRRRARPRAFFDGGRGRATVNVVYNGNMPDTLVQVPARRPSSSMPTRWSAA